jgi:predicted phage replisome organizer
MGIGTMISWIKLDINILDDAKIKIIRSHPDGNAIVVLWIGLLCLAMKSQRPGLIEISNALPYTLDDLSHLFNIDKKTCELGLHLFKKYKMVDLLEDGAIEVINFSKHQRLEDIEHKRELTKLRVDKFRAKQRQCNALLTHNSVTVTPTDLDLDLDLDKDKDKGVKKRRVFVKPTIEDITEYCKERKNNVNPQIWIDHYISNGWMVGKNKMNDWKAAVRTWEARNGNGSGNTKHSNDTYRRNPQSYRTERQPAELSADILADIAEANRLAAEKAPNKSAKVAT